MAGGPDRAAVVGMGGGGAGLRGTRALRWPPGVEMAAAGLRGPPHIGGHWD